MSNIRIIALDTATHVVVPRNAPESMAEVGVAGTFRDIPKAAVHDIYDAMLAAAPPPPALAVVKGLEWTRRSKYSLSAETPIGVFRVFYPGHGKRWRAVFLGRVDEFASSIKGRFESEESAVAACQAEFDRLVAECLAGRAHGGGE